MTDYDELNENRRLAPKKKGGFPALLEEMRPEIARALPRHLNPDRMSRIALTEFRKNPDIGKCDMKTVFGAIITLSQLGLEPGVMGQAFLIPYGDVCQGIPGWRGLADLVSRSGRASVWTGAVYRDDEFDYAYGDRPFIAHKPGDNIDQQPENLLYCYAVGRVKDAEWPVIEVWSTRKITAHRDKYNKVGKRHYSFHNFEMYGRKVALLQVIKYMPTSIEVQQAVDLENVAEAGQAINMSQALDGSWSAPPYVEPASKTANEQDEPPAEKPKNKTGKKKSAAKKDKKKGATKKAATKDETEESGPGMSYGEIFKGVTKAKHVEELDVLADAARELDEKKQKDMLAIIAEKRVNLEGTDEEANDLELE